MRPRAVLLCGSLITDTVPLINIHLNMTHLCNMLLKVLSVTNTAEVCDAAEADVS